MPSLTGLSSRASRSYKETSLPTLGVGSVYVQESTICTNVSAVQPCFLLLVVVLVIVLGVYHVG